MFVLALAALVAPGRAEAAERGIEPVRLTWTRAPGAESCPDGAAIEADVARRLGANPFRHDAAGAIDVHVSYEQGVWTAAIQFRPSDGPPGSRSVTSTAPTCESLALAAGLAISLTIRERASAEPEPPAPESPRCPECPPPEPPRALPDEREHAAVFLAGTAALGVLPRAAFGPSIVGRVPLGERVSVSGTMTFLPEQRVNAANASFGFGATYGGLVPCFAFLDGELASASVCASLLAGALHVVVRDATPLGPGARMWAAGALGLRLDWNPSGPWHVVLGADALARIQRHDYVVERGAGADTVFTEPAVGALLSLGVGVEP